MNASQGAVHERARVEATVKTPKATRENLAELVGRVLLAMLFLLSGLGKPDEATLITTEFAARVRRVTKAWNCILPRRQRSSHTSCRGDLG